MAVVGYFLTKIFHPNVHPSSGEICVNTLKKDWTLTTGIAQTLLAIKCLLIVPNAESALNEEAGKLLLEAYDEYANRARLMTRIHAECVMAEYKEIFEKEKSSNENSQPADAAGKEEGNSAANATSGAILELIRCIGLYPQITQ